MRPIKSDLIALLARALAGVAPTPAGYLTEAALAAVLGLDPRRLRAFRQAGIVAPRRLGRGFVYTEDEARTCAVTVALTELGLPFARIAAFLDDAPSADLGTAIDATAHGRCDRLLRDLVEEVETEIRALRDFQSLLTGWHDEIAGGPRPTDRG